MNDLSSSGSCSRVSPDLDLPAAFLSRTSKENPSAGSLAKSLDQPPVKRRVPEAGSLFRGPRGQLPTFIVAQPDDRHHFRLYTGYSYGMEQHSIRSRGFHPGTSALRGRRTLAAPNRAGRGACRRGDSRDTRTARGEDSGVRGSSIRDENPLRQAERDPGNHRPSDVPYRQRVVCRVLIASAVSLSDALSVDLELPAHLCRFHFEPEQFDETELAGRVSLAIEAATMAMQLEAPGCAAGRINSASREPATSSGGQKICRSRRDQIVTSAWPWGAAR